MGVVDLASKMVTAVRVRGEIPAYLAVSPDLYSLWQEENSGVEPTLILGLPIRIRDNYKPQTMLILGEKLEEPAASNVTLDSAMSKIEHGEYGPDAGASTLLRLTLRQNSTLQHDSAKVFREYCSSLERAREQLSRDAIQAVGLNSHPRAAEIYRFAEKMAGDDWDCVTILSILRRIGEFVHSKTLE